MDRKIASRWIFAVLVPLVLAGAGVAAGDEGAPIEPVVQFPAPTEPDTVRTNLWLTEALMGEIVTFAANSLPKEPATILLVDQGGQESDDVFGAVASVLLRSMGYELFLVSADSTVQAPVDFVFNFKVVGVELSYPEVGRTLGIWQRWVARDLKVTASVDISTADSGLLVFKDIVDRRYSDRIDNSDFSEVGSDLYDFTTADKAGSGWQRRTEEIVVLGTLVALIAVYFANTGN